MLALPAPPGTEPPRPDRVPILMYRNDPYDGQAVWTEKSLRVLAAYNRPPRLFQRGDTLCRIQDSPLSGRARLVTLDALMLKHHLSECTTWARVLLNSRGEPVIDSGDTPISVCENILAAPAWNPEAFPPIRALAESPCFAADGALLTEPGYYRSEELYISPPPGLELCPVSGAPTTSEVAAAKDLISAELLGDFGLDEASLAHSISYMLEPLVRRLIAGPTPLHVFDAPVHGAGKTLLASVLQIPCIGRAGEVTPPKQDDAEMRKAITAQLLRSPTYVVIDNVSQLHGFPSLAAALTSPSGVWSDRILGESRMLELPVYCALAVTANNLVMNRELQRRSVLIRLQPGVEEPWLRSGFRHSNLVAWALEHRAALLHAALTLISAWVSEGQPPGEARMGSFEGWARTMGGILATAGIAGFLGNRDKLFERDPESARWRSLAKEWARQHAARLVSVADLYQLITMSADLETAYADTLGEGSERKQRQRLAQALAAQDGRIWAGYAVELQHHAGHGGFPLYRLLPTQAAGGAEAETETVAEADPHGDAWEPDAWEPDSTTNPWDDPDR